MHLAIVKSLKSSKKKMGRPRVDALPVMVRLRPDEVAALDRWIETHDLPISRPLAIRMLVRAGTGIERKKR
jgi:hypothetical protein